MKKGSTPTKTENWSDEELLILTQLFLEEVRDDLGKYTTEQGEVKIYPALHQVEMTLPSHIQWAKYGRGPGKKPPFDEIFEWVKRENIQFENATQEGTAFAIQKSIGEHGTLNWVPNAPDALQEALSVRWEEYQHDLQKEIMIKVESEVSQIYSQVDYSKVFKQT